jgi:hypothetical protein
MAWVRAGGRGGVEGRGDLMWSAKMIVCKHDTIA